MLARRLLAESKYADPDTRPPITLTVSGSSEGPIPKDIEEVLKFWRQLGVEVEIQQMPWPDFQRDLAGNKYQAFGGLGWSADYPDPHGYLDLLFHTDSSHNHLSYSNREVESLLEQARVQQDASLRLEMYGDAERLIVGDAAWLPLWHPGDRYALVKPHIKGLKFTPAFHFEV